MSIARRRHAGRRVKDAIAVFEKNKGTIIFTADEGQAPLKPPASPQRPSAAPSPAGQSERTTIPATGDTRSERSRNAKVGEWTKEKVYVLELTRDRVSDQGQRQLRTGPVTTVPVTTGTDQERTSDSGKDDTVDRKQSLQQATSSSSVSLQARQAGEWPRSGVLDLLTEAQQLVEELMVQGVASPRPLLQPGCPTHDTGEQQLRAVVWRLEIENASLRRELDSVRREEESCRTQLSELHDAYFSLQQCLGRRVQRVQAGRAGAAELGEDTSEKTGHYRPLSRAASNQESSV